MEEFDKSLQTLKDQDKKSIVKRLQTSIKHGAFMATPKQLMPQKKRRFLERLGTIKRSQFDNDEENPRKHSTLGPGNNYKS